MRLGACATATHLAAYDRLSRLVRPLTLSLAAYACESPPSHEASQIIRSLEAAL